MTGKQCLNGCKFSKEIHASNNFRFIGCIHEPYKGKWVQEIKTEECPLNKKRGSETDGR